MSLSNGVLRATDDHRATQSEAEYGRMVESELGFANLDYEFEHMKDV